MWFITADPVGCLPKNTGCNLEHLRKHVTLKRTLPSHLTLCVFTNFIGAAQSFQTRPQPSVANFSWNFLFVLIMTLFPLLRAATAGPFFSSKFDL